MSSGGCIVSVGPLNQTNQTYPILLRAAVFARSVEEAEEALCAWADEVSCPDADRGVATVNISLPADARPGIRRSWRWGWRRRFTFPLAGQITLVYQVTPVTSEEGGTSGQSRMEKRKEAWDARATRSAATRGIDLTLR